MRNRLLVLVLIFFLACVSLALLLDYSNRDGLVTLAELTALDKNGAAPANRFSELARSVREGGVWLASLELESFFYAVLGICGILLALRTVVSALYIIKEERLPKIPEPAKTGFAAAPDVVIARYRESPIISEPAVAQPEIPNSAAEKLPGSGWWTRRRHFLSNDVWTRLAPYRHGLTGRLIVSFTTIVAAFGLLAVSVVHLTLTASLRRHAIERARVTAVNVSDSAAGYVVKKNAGGLRELLRKQANRPEIAYVLVQNRAGAIFAHSFAVLPQEVQNVPAFGGTPDESQRSLKIGDGDVYEVTVPILDGQIGAVRLGIWRDELDAEISRTLKPLVKILLLVVSGGVLMAVYLAWKINRPIIRLVRAAQRISHGDLETPSLGTEDRTEFGELSRALERMRSSIKAALVRLSDEG